jgi:integrase
MRLPVDLQPLLGVKYLKKTLKLKDIDDKKRFKSRLYVDVQKFIFTLREYIPKKKDADRSLGNMLIHIIQNDETEAVEGIEVTKSRYGKVENKYNIPISGMPAFAIPITRKPLSEVITEYCSEKIKGGNWTPKTQIEFKAFLNVLLEIVGDVDVKDINYQIMKNYKDTLGRLPANRKKLPKYRDMTIKQILEIPEADVKPMHLKTANRNLSLVSTMLNWAIKQGYLDKNYAEGLSFPVKTRPSEERSSYGNEEIVKIIALINGIERRNRPEHYWIPLIAMFSGMRMGEMCQLFKEDIKEIKGVWSFEISYKHGIKKIKTKAGERVVPIHKNLISLGLLDFVDSAKPGHLWTNLKYDDKHGYTHDFQRWFGYLNRKRITTDPKKTFHSLRHNVADYLKQHGISGDIIEELLGHELKSQSTGRYAGQYRPDVLKPILDTVDYGVALPVPFYSK